MTETILNKINEILKKADFETLFLDEYSNKKSKFCFDILVKKEDSIFSVKLISNIDNISPEIIDDIKSLSLLLNSKPLLIGVRNRYQKLEDNTIYIREGLPFITLNTLENILTRNKYPYILAKRGGGVVFLNGALMKEFREQHLISRKELSEKLLRQGMNENILRGSTFVGATFPGRWKWARILDTDDDIGFLRLKDEFLSYVGDGGNFEIEKDRLLSLNRKMNKPFFIYALKWIVVKFRSEQGEGREVLFCSREGKSILQCRKNTNLLFDKLVKWSSSSEQYG